MTPLGTFKPFFENCFLKNCGLKPKKDLLWHPFEEAFLIPVGTFIFLYVAGPSFWLTSLWVNFSLYLSKLFVEAEELGHLQLAVNRPDE